MVVWSPAGKISRSDASCARRTAFSYLFSSYTWPNTMFSLTVAFKIHACCAQNDTAPLTLISPLLHVTNLLSAEASVDLPQPTGPTIMVRVRGFTSKSSPASSNGSSSATVTFTTVSSTVTASSNLSSSIFFSFFSFVSFFSFLLDRPGGPFGASSSGFFGSVGQATVASVHLTVPGSERSTSYSSHSSASRKDAKR